MPELVKKADEVTSVGVQAGEGWLLTAEILELIESGCPNVVCAQPFACLPNHVTGRGMFGKIRRLHPEANIVSIDYDPGASEANQLNRIKLMIAAARRCTRSSRARRRIVSRCMTRDEKADSRIYIWLSAYNHLAWEKDGYEISIGQSPV